MTGRHGSGESLAASSIPPPWQFVREVAQNLAMAVPPIRAAAAQRHTLREEPPADESVYEAFRRHAEVAGKAVLELGPGRRLDSLRMARRDGAARCTAVDVIGYRVPEEAAQAGIEYQVYDGRRLPFGDAEFDVVWSWAVLEHLRFPEVTIPEMRRILKPNGLVIARVDLRDHYHLVSGPWKERVEWLDCLRYPAWVWRAMKWYRAAYVNRLRYSDWLRVFADAGFEPVDIRPQRSELLKSAHRRLPFLQRYDEDDVSIFGIDVVYRRPAAA
jgi:SAM-dependent methyltransferase